MGRHAAPGASGEPARPVTGPTPIITSAAPVTDPRLFDAPPARRPAGPARPAPTASHTPARPAPGARPVSVAPARPAPAARPVPAATLTPAGPAPARPTAARTAAPMAAAPARPIARTAAPVRPVAAPTPRVAAAPAPGVAPAPAPRVAAAPAPRVAAAPARPVAPAPQPSTLARAAQFAPAVATAPPAPEPEPRPRSLAELVGNTGKATVPEETSTAFSRGRSVKLAACAVAVLGAVSGAALLVPNHGALATADEIPNPTTSPIPTSATRALQAEGHARHHLVHHPLAAPLARKHAHSAEPARTTASPRATAQSHTPAPSASPIRTAVAPHVPAVATTGTSLASIVGGAANGSLLSLAAGNYVMRDFDANLMGVDLHGDGLAGAGVDKTVIEMAPNASSKAGQVPTAAYSTNQLYLLSTIGGTPGLSGFTLKATPQGHLYNGLRIGKATNAHVHDVKVVSVPGNNSFPPGETFVLNDWRTSGSVYDNVTIDGGGVSAAGFGVNSSTDITINNSTFTGTAYSSGGAFWQSKNITMNDVKAVDNRSGMNFERDTGTITLNRPTFRNNRLYDMQFGSDQGGANVIINDPVLAPGQKIRMNVPLQYHGGPNNQSRGNIHVYVHGVDRTSELVQFL